MYVLLLFTLARLDALGQQWMETGDGEKYFYAPFFVGGHGNIKPECFTSR
jgi:hypothetical protein